MRRIAVLLVAAVISGCGGGEEAGTGAIGTAAIVARCDSVGLAGERSYSLCKDGTFWVWVEGDGRDARPLDVRSPPGIGHWAWAALSPDGSTLLAQWIAECEVPVAYFIPVDGGRMRAAVGVAVESIALGWTPGGEARVALPKGVCGASGASPGVYAVSIDGQKRFLRPFDAARDRVHT